MWLGFLAVVVISLLPAVGFVGLALTPRQLDRARFLLVSFATGALLGDALIHLLPEAYMRVGNELASALMVLAGIALFFLIERAVHFHHSPLECEQQAAVDPEHFEHAPAHFHAHGYGHAHGHFHASPHQHHHQPQHQHAGPGAAAGDSLHHRDPRASRPPATLSNAEIRDRKSLLVISVFGDLVHNLMDGLLIGAAFQVNPTIGWSTTLAVALHEVPQELGDLGVLLHAGLSPARAAMVNLLCGVTAVVGFLLSMVVGQATGEFAVWFLPVAAGGFLYLAGSVLVPEMRKEEPGALRILMQVLAMGAGIASMAALKFMD